MLKIFECEHMSKEVIEQITQNNNARVSNIYNYIITTGEVFDQLIAGKVIKIVSDDYCGNENNITLDLAICDNLENWIETNFMGEECSFFNQEIDLTIFAESARCDIDYMIKNENFLNDKEEDWGEVIYTMLKKEASARIKQLLKDELTKLEEDGYSIKM